MARSFSTCVDDPTEQSHSNEIAVLDGVTSWMQVNGEAIYETRPWKVSSEGPDMVTAGSFQGGSVSKLCERDIRFTRNKASSVIYAAVLGSPAEPILIQSLGLSTARVPAKWHGSNSWELEQESIGGKNRTS